MGLFGRKKRAEPLGEREALAGIAYCALYADEVVGAEEDDELIETLTGLEAFAGATEDEIRETLIRVNGLAAELGDAGLLDASCAALPAALRPVAYGIAITILDADGEVLSDEDHFAHRLQKRLGLTDEECEAVRNAMR